MSATQASSGLQEIDSESQENIRSFLKKLRRYCHANGYTLGLIPEKLTWNCSRILQRADDECATVNISFTYFTWGDCFGGVAQITRVFFVGGGYDFEWKANHINDHIYVSDLIDFFINVDTYVEVPFERIRDNEFITFGKESDEYENFGADNVVKILQSAHQRGWVYGGCKKSPDLVVYQCNDGYFLRPTAGYVYFEKTNYHWDVYGHLQITIFEKRNPDIVFEIHIRRQRIKSKKRMESWIKGYLYQLTQLKVGDIPTTRAKVAKRYKNIEQIITSVHAPQQHESDGDGGGGGGGESKGTASQMTKVASILETIHERVSKLEFNQ